MKMKTDVLKKAIQVFGYKNQKIVAIEELSELQKEITKDLRGKGNIEHIAEEIADVYIMLDQLKIMFNISQTKINRYSVKKLRRLENTIEKTISEIYKEE